MDKANGKGGIGALQVLYAVFAVALIAFFLSFRGSDVGQIGQLLGSAGGTWIGPAAAESLVGLTVAAMIGVSWWAVGRVLLTVVGSLKIDGWDRHLRFAFECGIGGAFWSFIWFVLGAVGAYRSTAALICVAVGIAVAIAAWIKTSNGEQKAVVLEPTSVFTHVMRVLVLIPLALGVVGSLAPPTAKDTLLYHFAVPKGFIAQGGSGVIEGNIASYLSLGGEMHSLWAMLLGRLFSERASEAAAGAVIYLFFPLLLFAIYGWCRELGIPRLLRYAAVLAVASIPTVYHVSSSGYIDVALAFYVLLGVVALSRWWSTKDFADVALAGVFLGTALGLKLTTVFVIAGAVLVILLKARNAGERSKDMVLAGAGAILLAAVVASPWYLRTWYVTGSPVFPFYMNIWRGEAPGWDVERSGLFQAMNSQYGEADQSPVNYFTALVRVSLTAQPERAAAFDGVFGPVLLFGVPLLIFSLWRLGLPAEAKIAAGTAVVIFLFWLFTSQQIRYLLPAAPLVAIAASVAAWKISQTKSRMHDVFSFGIAGIGAACVLVSVAWFLQRSPLRVVLGGEGRDEFLSRNLDYYPYYREINSSTAPDSKVWLINTRRDTYNIDRPVFSDYLFEDWTLRRMVWDARNVQELRAKTSAMGIKYVLARHDFMLNMNTSTLVDDNRSRAENEAKLRMTREFLLDPQRTIKSEGKFSLIRTFSE